MEERTILIGGAPTTGKTFLANKLSEEIGVPWFSTDMIRRTMKETVREEDYPNLFKFEDLEPEDYLSHHSPEGIVKDQNEESREVWKGTKPLIEFNWTWGPWIIEGVAILPALVDKDFSNSKSVKPIFLLIENEERVREVVFQRGLWGDAENYPDSLKEKEVKWIIRFNGWLRRETEKYNYPKVELSGEEVPMSEMKNKLDLN